MTMSRSRWAAFVAAAVGTAAFAASAGAQVTEVARTPIAEAAQLTFGYRCDDRFVIRNDGAKPVDLEYGVEKGTEHTKLTLGARELIELDSKSKEAMELWMDGKLIAKAIKEKRSCKDVAGTATVLVAPLEVQTNERDRGNNARNVGVGFYDPFFYGGYYGGYYSGFGYRPFYSPYFGTAIIIGGPRGGIRRR